MAGLLMPVRPLFAQQAGADQSKPVATQTQDAKNPEADENDAYLHSDAVKAIGAKLGMTTEQAATAFQIANFAVLALAVLWLVVKLLPKMLPRQEHRDSEASGGCAHGDRRGECAVEQRGRAAEQAGRADRCDAGPGGKGFRRG